MRFKTEDGRYACKYPQERPIDDVQVDVWGEDGGYIGVGIGSHRNNCGGVIVVNGRVYDSNTTVNWLPVRDKP